MSKDTFYTIVSINWFLRAVGLSNIYRKGIHVKESRSKIKSTVYVIGFGILNIYYLYYKISYILAKGKSGAISFSGTVQLTYLLSYCEYIIDVYFVYQYRHVSDLNSLKGFDHIDTILGNACYDNIRGTVTGCVIFATTIYIFNSIFDYISWILVEGLEPASIYAVDYLYFLLNMLTVLDINSHIIQVEYRLKMIAELLQNNKSKNIFELRNNHASSNFLTEKNTNKSLNSLKTLNASKYMEMIWFSRCYLLLVDQVGHLNTRYGFRVLVYCVNLLINIINNLNVAIRIVSGTLQLIHPYGNLSFLPSISSTMRALNYSIMVTMLMYRCEKAYAQSEKILETVDTLLSDDDNNSKAYLLEFRNLLITRPIRFHAAKFFTMDYSLLVSLSSAVVTYTIIILQSMQ